MADPFSITGSAVGVVSLAIQVCKGLEWYLSGVKEAKNKAEQIAAETEELANLLESLESIIGKINPSHSVSATRAGIVSCADAIATIRKKLKPDDQAANGGIKSNLKRLTKRLAFPFEETEIKYWKDVLNTVQQSLQTALLALVLDEQRLTSEDQRRQFTQLCMMINAYHISNQEFRRDIFNSTRFQLDHLSHVIETKFSNTSLALQSLHAELLSLPAQLVDAISATDATLDDDVKSIRRFQRKPRKVKQRSAQFSCTCRPQIVALVYRTSLFSLTGSRTSLHDSQCPQYAFQNAVTNLQVQATLCSLLLRKKVLLSFQLSHGAKLSVKHNLESHRVVRWSPAFEFTRTLVESSMNMPTNTFRSEVEKLYRMFQLKQASPHDRLANGRTLLHEVSNCISSLNRKNSFANAFENLAYLFKILLSLMPSEAFETDDNGVTCVDILMDYDPLFRNRNTHVGLLKALFGQGLQITRQTYYLAGKRSTMALSVLAEIRYESFTSPILGDNELLEAIFMKSDHQLQESLHQPRYSRTLNGETFVNALIISTITGWMDGCRALLNANVVEYLEDPSFDMRWISQTLLQLSAATNRLDMLQFWLSQRETCCGPLLELVGHFEDALALDSFRSETPTMDVVQLVSSHIIKQRHEVKLLMEKHDIQHCCESARTSLPDAHVRCMLAALVNGGIEVPQRYRPERKSLYYMRQVWKVDKLKIFDSLELAGICDISQDSFKCNKETACSPLVYLATEFMESTGSMCLTERNLTVRWFLSKGANLRETWPGTNITAVHCLAWQSARCLGYKVKYPGNVDVSIMEASWAYEDYEFLVKEEIFDECECGCNRSGCDFLSCFWKHTFAESWYSTQFLLICEIFENATLARDLESVRLYADNDDDDDEIRRRNFAMILLDLTLWVDRAESTLALPRIIHEYIRLFAFSYLEIRHTCCDINRIQHRNDWWYGEDPNSTRQPYPRYSTKELRRITNEDAHLRARLEQSVPELITRHDSFEGKLQDFVSDVLIPTMRKIAKELKEEDKALYAAGRRELGVVMDEDEDEDDSEEERSEVEEEEADAEEDSDDEY